MDLNRKAELNTDDHLHMDAFLGHILDDYKAGILDKEQAVGGLAHVMAALDRGNYDLARLWLRQGRKLIRRGT